MDLKTFYFFTYCTIASALIPFSFGLVRFSSNLLYLKLLFILTGVSFLCDVLSVFIPGSSNYAGNLYRLAEFGLLTLIFYNVIDRPRWRVFFLSGSLIFVVFFVVNILFLQRDKINSYTNTLSALIFITMSIVYFYQLITELPAGQIYYLPMFWIGIAVLIYFSGSLFVFALTNYLTSVLKSDLIVYWGFHNFLEIVKNLLFTVALWLNLRMPKSV